MKKKLPSFPAISSKLLLTASAGRRMLNPVWYRAIQSHFLTGVPGTPPTPLHTGHTTTIPGRFNDGMPARPSFPVLYLAEDHMVALFEVQALLGSPTTPGGTIPHPRTTWTILNVRVNLTYVADLTIEKQQDLFGTNAQELTGDWRGYGPRTPSTSVYEPRVFPAPTQALGRTLYKYLKVEGFLAVSAKLPEKMTLVIFPDKLIPGSYIEFYNPADGKTYSLRGPISAGSPTFKAKR